MSRDGEGGGEPDADERSNGVRSRSSRGARLAVARRELGSLRAEKTILLAIAIQLFIAAFSSFLVVGLVSMYDPGSIDGYRAEIAVTGDDTDELVRVANEREALSANVYERADARRAFERGEVDAVLETNRNDDGRLVVSVTAPDDGLRTTLLVVQLQDALESLERVERQANADRLEEAPLSIPDEVEASPYVTFTYTVLLPLLLFLPVFISGSIVVDSLAEERQRGTLELLRVSPLSLPEIVEAKLLATAALAPVQATAWLVLFAFNGTAVAAPLVLVALVAALSLLVAGFGAAVALYAPDRRQAQLCYSVVLVGALVVASLLPEHPANTVAKFALGAATGTTWALFALYCLLAIATFAGLRAAVGRLDPDSLSRTR